MARALTLVRIMNNNKNKQYIIDDCKKQLRKLHIHVIYDGYINEWKIIG